MQHSSAKAVQQREEFPPALAPGAAHEHRGAESASTLMGRLRHWRERLLSRLLELLEPRNVDI